MALSAPPGSNCPDQHVSIFSVIFLYKVSSPPTPCVVHKNIFISSLKQDVDVYKYLPTNVMRSVGSTVHPGIADRVWKIMFITLTPMKIKIINGISDGTLSRSQEPSWFPSLLSSRCGSASWTKNLDQNMITEKKWLQVGQDN